MSTLPRASTASMHLASGQVNISGKLLYNAQHGVKNTWQVYTQHGINNARQFLCAVWHTKTRGKFYPQHAITNAR